MQMGNIQARELFKSVDGNINPIDEAFCDELLKSL